MLKGEKAGLRDLWKGKKRILGKLVVARERRRSMFLEDQALHKKTTPTATRLWWLWPRLHHSSVVSIIIAWSYEGCLFHRGFIYLCNKRECWALKSDIPTEVEGNYVDPKGCTPFSPFWNIV